jgi:bifunctional N-acetylglucosamine-1-phosphate-uridyltransferase/glucosamine-1-phosphate-acetyltransferase GlmU-like protein
VRYLPPRPWLQVAPGDIVMSFNGTAHTVLTNDPHPRLIGHRTLLLEGVEPLIVRDFMHACVVELDESDAIGTLHASGLNPAPIEGN